MSGQDTLVVISKVKEYIRAQADLNTAAAVAPKLSDIIRRFCNNAIASAKKDGRKTVMEKDFVE